MDQKKDLPSYAGPFSPGDRSPADPLDPVRLQIRDGLNSGFPSPSGVLFAHARCFDLVTNALLSSMEFIASSMVASKHHDHSVVFNHCSGLPFAVFFNLSWRTLILLLFTCWSHASFHTCLFPASKLPRGSVCLAGGTFHPRSLRAGSYCLKKLLQKLLQS